MPERAAPLQVLHLVTHLDFGGVERRMQILAELAGQSRYLHRFCALGQGGAAAQTLQALGAEVTLLHAPVKSPSWPALRLLRRLLRHQPAQILHMHGAEANFHGTLAAQGLPGLRLVAEDIGLPRHRRLVRQIYRQLYRRCDGHIAISQAVADALIDLGESKPAQLTVLHNPCRSVDFRPLPRRGAELRLGYVGRLSPEKNPLAALEALALLHRQGLRARLDMVGDGPERAALEGQTRLRGLCDWVQFHGYQAEPFAALAQCDLYLQPSLHEGFGLAICEAMSRGLPVIACGQGGAGEIITEGVTGWLLPRSDAASLAQKIKLVAALPLDAVVQVAARGSASVRQRFAPSAYLQRLEQFYDGICRCGARR